MTERQKSLGIAAVWAAAFLGIALALSACAGGGQSLTPRQQLLATCDAYSSTLTTLASLRASGKLTEDQIQSVNNARRVLNPICQDGRPLDGTTEQIKAALRRVEAELFRLQNIRQEAQ